MENPYASPNVTPELAEESRSRSSRPWRSILLAYGVHHGCCLLGIFAGLLFVPSEWNKAFPPDRPWDGVGVLVFTPAINLYLLVEPLFAGDIVPADYLPLRWMRSALVVTIPIAGLTYIISRRRAALWYLGVVSGVLTLSFVISTARDNKQLLQSSRDTSASSLSGFVMNHK